MDQNEKNENLDEWQDRKFKEFYDREFSFLQRLVDAGKTDVQELKGKLQSLYIFDGNNLEGRSLIMQLSLSASIAAYEAIIAKLS